MSKKHVIIFVFLFAYQLFSAAAGGAGSAPVASSLFASSYGERPYSLTPEEQVARWNLLKSVAAYYPEFCETYDPDALISLVQTPLDTRNLKERGTRDALKLGSMKAGESLLLYAEKGLGDTLMWIRYVPQLISRFPGLKITVSVQKPLLCLKEMLGDEAKEITFVAGADPGSGEYDYCLSLFELPFVLNEPLPDGEAYLNGPTLDDGVKRDLEALARGRLKVGICFRGAKEHRCNEQRSVPLDAFKPLIERPDVCVFSLQVGDGQERVKEIAGLIDLSLHLKSIADTAAYIKNLDLVITADSMIGHLAGALGVPTIMLLCIHPDFRWACGTEEASPWYNKHVLARQHVGEDWAVVINRAIEKFVSERRKPSGVEVMQLF